MIRNIRLLTLIAFAILMPFLITLSAAEMNNVDIFKVTASKLIVRESADAKSRALFSIPKGTYVINSKARQDKTIYTVGNAKGRWIEFTGYHDYPLGYVFEGFLEKAEGMKSFEVESDCVITGKDIKCGNDIFKFTDQTPLAGGWFKNPETCDGNMTFIYSNSPALVNELSKDNQKGDLVLILKDKTLVQFVATPPARGGGCE